MANDKRRIAELKDEIKQRDRRIEELRAEIDEQRDLISRLREHAEDYDNCIESWKEAFGMTITDSGGWTWKPFWDNVDKLLKDHSKLVNDWNRFLPRINGEPRNVGRPLEASEAQCAEVLGLRTAGYSLRGIAEETSLGLNTVCTIIAKKNGTDRTTKKHRQRLERVDLSQQAATWRRQRRTGSTLPKRAQRVVEAGQALIKEAKGLGRAK